MRLTMSEKKSLTRIFAKKYRYATKLEKINILDEFIEYTGYNRNYATRVLRNNYFRNYKNQKKNKRKRKQYYNDDVRKALERIWEISDYICGKRLTAILPELLQKLEQFNELEITNTIKERLKKISAATIDRLLKPARKRLGRKGTSMTKGTTYLIDKIPIKTFGEWKDTPTGYTQLDLVAHNGGNVYGGFLYTLNATDVGTSWTTCTLVRDKTMFQMLKGLISMKKSFPFPLNGMHSDNGSEFINDAALAFANKYNIEFTRGRPYKKNDNPHIEQKNYSVLRRNTGYLRYDKPEHAEVLRELYSYLNLYVNYFQPTMVLLEKHRKGAKATRKYDTPKTPYQRLLARDDVDDSIKSQIRTIYERLNPAELKRKINKCQSRLIRMAAPIRMPVKPKKIRRKKDVKHTRPGWRRESIPGNPNPFLERQRLEELRRAVDKIEDTRNLKN